MEQFCPWDASYLLVSENTPTLLPYSHGISIIAALLLGFLLYRRNKSLLTGLFFTITILFSVWGVFDLIQWATNRPDTLLFYWSLSIPIEVAIYLLGFYLVQVFITKKDIPFRQKVWMVLAGLPLLVLAPTKHLLSGVYIDYCNAVESSFAIYYTYGLEALIILLLFIRSAFQIHKEEYSDRAIENWFFVGGIIIFLLAFSSGNIIGSITEDWNIAQYGLFGMPIFIGFLVYLMIKYKSFNSKVLGAQILVAALLVLLGSLVFIGNIQSARIIIGVTFLTTLFVGRALVRNVKVEIKQKESLETLSVALEESNQKLTAVDKLKTEFLSLASHQLRSPLTAIKGYASMLVEGSFDKLTDKQSEGVKRIYASAQGLVNLVEDLLNVSKIEQGGMKYEMMEVGLTKIVSDLYEEMKIPAENKHLKLSLETPSHDECIVFADPVKLKQVFLNLVDNSIKYTIEGFVNMSLTRSEGSIVFTIVDSGVGISPETKKKLFGKFSRGEGGKMNTGGSGLGLYLAREITKAHKGELRIESEGLGKGSTFIVTLPALGKAIIQAA